MIKPAIIALMILTGCEAISRGEETICVGVCKHTEAEAGTDNEKGMTPLRVAQYAAANPFGTAIEPSAIPAQYADPENPTAQEELDYAISQKILEIEKEFFVRSDADGLCFPLKSAQALGLVFAPISPATPESTRFFGNIGAASVSIVYVSALTDINDVIAFDVQTDVSWTA